MERRISYQPKILSIFRDPGFTSMITECKKHDNMSIFFPKVQMTLHGIGQRKLVGWVMELLLPIKLKPFVAFDTFIIIFHLQIHESVNTKQHQGSVK